MSLWYKLDDDNNVIKADDVQDQFAWLDRRRAAEGQELPVGTLQVRYDIVDGHTVSTVFLGLDHGFGRGVPIVFETMTFGEPYEQDQWRYATWDEAVAGHERIVAALRNGEAPAE